MADKQNVPQYITAYGLEKEQYDIVKKALKSCLMKDGLCCLSFIKSFAVSLMKR